MRLGFLGAFRCVFYWSLQNAETNDCWHTSSRVLGFSMQVSCVAEIGNCVLELKTRYDVFLTTKSAVSPRRPHGFAGKIQDFLIKGLRPYKPKIKSQNTPPPQEAQFHFPPKQEVFGVVCWDLHVTVWSPRRETWFAETLEVPLYLNCAVTRECAALTLIRALVELKSFQAIVFFPPIHSLYQVLLLQRLLPKDEHSITRTTTRSKLHNVFPTLCSCFSSFFKQILSWKMKNLDSGCEFFCRIGFCCFSPDL